MQRRESCFACGVRLPRCTRADRRYCGATCRMRAHRMRRAASGVSPARPYGARQPIPKRHHGPPLIRVAAAMQTRAEHAEKECIALRERQAKEGAERTRAREELVTLRRSVKEQERRHAESLATARREQEASRLKQQEALTEARRQATAAKQATEDLRRQLAMLTNGEEQQRKRAEQAERALAEQTKAHAGHPRLLAELRTKLERTERAHQEVVSVAEGLQRSLSVEQARRADLEKRLDEALRTPKVPPSASAEQKSDSDALWRAQKRAEQLTAELQQLRRHRDEVMHERERLSSRILRMMAPGQYLTHAAAAGYDPTTDPLIQQKRIELRVLHRYAGWQSVYMQRVTARTIDGAKTLDEQAIEAALAARWKLVNKPLVRLRSKPFWILVGFLLDERTEQFLLQQSAEKIAEMEGRMGRQG